MSATALRDAAIADLTEAKQAKIDELAGRYTDTLDTMRFNQGYIAGLARAIEIVGDRANNLHAKDGSWH